MGRYGPRHPNPVTTNFDMPNLGTIHRWCRLDTVRQKKRQVAGTTYPFLLQGLSSAYLLICLSRLTLRFKTCGKAFGS